LRRRDINLLRFDLPLRHGAASRFLPSIIGGLLYLAVVALAVAAIADEALHRYDLRRELVTVTLPSVEDGRAGEQQVAQAIDLLRRTSGVTSAVAVPPEELKALVEPWLGTPDSDLDLPLPRLIDVTIEPQAGPDLSALEKRLAEVVSGATIRVEALARDRAERSAAFFRAWGSAAGIGALLGTLALAALITRISLRMSADSVELLRCMGAPDQYLARQFERHALLSSGQGGLIGCVLALVTVGILLYSSRRMQLAEGIELQVPPLDWALLVCVPVVAALLITAVTRMTALWSLSRTA
jgi:cell division transport system permease protein